jgi:hypothetical protein
MYCSRCGTNNREGSKFCNNCGVQLTPPDITCPACGIVNPSKNAFCNNCGARLKPPAAARPEPQPAIPPMKGLSLPTKTPAFLPVEPPAPAGDGAGEKGAEEAGTRGSEAQETGDTHEAESPFAGEVPDWLAQLRAAPPVEEETTESTPVSADIPDWIRQLQTIEPEESAAEPAPPAEEPPAQPAPVSEDTPSWVRHLQSIKPEEPKPAPSAEELPAGPVEPTEPTEPAGVPAWLEQPSESSWLPQQEATPPTAEVTEGQPTAAEEPPAAPSFSLEEDLPEPPPAGIGTAFPVGEKDASTASVGTEAVGTEAVGTEAIGAVDQSGLPDWLQDLHPEKPAAPEAPAEGQPAAEGQPLAKEPSAPAGSSLPDWLMAGTSGEQQPSLAELPAWLRTAMPAEKPQEASLEELLAEPATPPVSGAPAQGVAVEPSESRAPVAAGDLEVEPLDAGTPLAGLRGVIPLAMAVAEPHMSVEKPPLRAASEKDDGARIFEAILTEAPTEAEPRSTRRPARVQTMRPVIYLLLALAVILPFFFPRNVAQSLLQISRTPAADVYDLLQTLPAGSTALVAFDYDPGTAGEMNLLANAIVRHLMQRRIKIVALSTNETGPQIAQKILSSAAEGAKDYRYGSEYVNVGYIPGHEAGLANLAVGGLPAIKDYGQGHDVRQYPVAQNIRSVNDVALIVELAGSEEPLKWWMEQVQPRTPTRIVAAVSAAVEPKARVYLRPGQLAGFVSGLIGAAQYEILSNQPGQALTSINAQSAAQVVLIMIVLLGNIVYWVSRAGQRGSTRARPEKAT